MRHPQKIVLLWVYSLHAPIFLLIWLNLERRWKFQRGSIHEWTTNAWTRLNRGKKRSDSHSTAPAYPSQPCLLRNHSRTILFLISSFSWNRLFSWFARDSILLIKTERLIRSCSFSLWNVRSWIRHRKRGNQFSVKTLVLELLTGEVAISSVFSPILSFLLL